MQANKEYIARDQMPPWAGLRTVSDTWLNPGKVVYMVVNKGGGSNPRIGGWASPERFSSVEDARRRLALLPEFKPNDVCCDIVALKVISPIPVREGWVGSLFSKEANKTYPGGALQWHLLVDTRDSNWRKYFSLVGNPVPLK